MFDIVNGKVRARKWPRGRGRPKTKLQKAAQDKFAAVQSASRYMDPQMMAEIVDATDTTPLLPRDMFGMVAYNTIAMFILPDGRKLYPMPYQKEVSEALDSITQTPGEVLIRGEDGWTGTVIEGGGGDWWDEIPLPENSTPWSTSVTLPEMLFYDGLGTIADFGPATNTNVMKGLAMTPPPPAGDFQLEAALSYITTQSSARRVGIYVGNRATGKWAGFGAVCVAGPQIQMWQGNFGDTLPGVRNTWSVAGFRDALHMKMWRVGDRLKVAFSGNGVKFYELDSWSLASVIGADPDEWGWIAYQNNPPANHVNLVAELLRWEGGPLSA